MDTTGIRENPNDIYQNQRGREVEASNCPYCGAPYFGGASFCANCGKPSIVAPVNDERRSKFSASDRRALLLAGVAFGCLVVVILVARSMQSSQTDSQSPSPVTATETDSPSPDSGPSTSAAPATSATPVPPPTSPSQDSAPVADPPIDFRDADSLDQRYGISAMSRCAGYADDYLRSVAKYDYKWDDIDWLDQKFDKYLKDVPAPGVLVMVSDKVKLQNGFGAFQRVQLRCDYDTQANTTSFTLIQ